MTPLAYIEEKLRLFCRSKCTSCDIHILMKDSLKCRENELEALKVAVEALSNIKVYGDHSGVIPCPQDYHGYIVPIQQKSEQAINKITELLK